MAQAKKPGLLLISVGTIMTSMIISGFVLGFFVDYWLNTTPLCLLSFGLLGIIGGSLKAYKLLTNPDFH